MSDGTVSVVARDEDLDFVNVMQLGREWRRNIEHSSASDVLKAATEE